MQEEVFIDANGDFITRGTGTASRISKDLGRPQEAILAIVSSGAGHGVIGKPVREATPEEKARLEAWYQKWHEIYSAS